MKLHLPAKLRSALLTCVAATATFATSLGTGTITGGSLVAALTVSSQARAAVSVTGEGTATNPYVISGTATSNADGEKLDLAPYGAGTYVTLNVTDGYFSRPASNPPKEYTYAANIEIQELTLYNGWNAGYTYNFTGTLTGTGNIKYEPHDYGNVDNGYVTTNS